MALRVLVAPDKFKGTLPSPEVCAAIAAGWRRVRPDDELVTMPMADGGDGTAAALLGAFPAAEWVTTWSVDAVGRPFRGRYLRAGETAVIELAEVCGLAALESPDPMGSHTIGLGIVVTAAMRSGARRLLVALGGSASTDGGAGLLSALGAHLIGRGGILPVGGGGLSNLARVDLDQLIPLPDQGVEVLVDVDAPLLGPRGAAAVFGPQKGASAEQIAELEAGLSRLAAVLGGSTDAPGAGAAGGTGYGMACWGATLVSGAARVGGLIGLDGAVDRADLVITGDGRYAETSTSGKASGYVLSLAGARPTVVIAGAVAEELRGDRVFSLTEIAGSTQAARNDPARWITVAAEQAARSV
jgi:glycerate kinase